MNYVIVALLTFVIFAAIPVILILAIVNRKKKRKGSTYIVLEEDYVTGVGEIVSEGAGFGGVSFGSGGVRPMIGGTPAKHKLRGFKIPYNKIVGVDLLVNESGIVLIAHTATYHCYIKNAPDVQDAIVRKIGAV